MSSDDPFIYDSEDTGKSSISPKWVFYTFIGLVSLIVTLFGSIAVYCYIYNLRQRRIERGAMRNNTYVPPTPLGPVRPELWEVHLDSEGSGGGGGGQQLGSSSIGSGRGDVELNDTDWTSEDSRDCWEFFKPIYAGFAEPPILPSATSSSLNLPTSPSPPPYIHGPVLAPINPSAPRGDDEESQLTAEVPTTSSSESLLARERIFMNLDSTSTTVPESPTQPKIRVAVLVAMPSPTPSHRDVSTTPLSSSASSSSSLSSKSQATISQSPELLPSPTTTLRSTYDRDEEQSLPHLEMGVADFVVGRSTSIRDSSSWYSEHSTVTSRREDTSRNRTNYSRESSYTAAEH